MKKRTKRLLAMLLASAMIMQQGSTVGVLATESEPASETVAETTAATEAETKTPETKAPETQAPETKAPETQAVSETQATEAATSAAQTETATSETTETTEKVTEAAATEATEAPAETGKTPDAEADTDDVTEKADEAEETEAPKTNFTYEDSRVKITAVAQEAAKLPQDAQIHADYMKPGTPEYQAAAAALEAAYAGKDVVLDYVFYDIYFTAASAGNGRIEPEAGTVTVSMQFKQPELKPEADAEVQTYDVVHVENGKAQEVPSNVQTTGDGSVASVGFTSSDFSPYAVVMSVEEQDEVATIGADEPMPIDGEVNQSATVNVSSTQPEGNTGTSLKVNVDTTDSKVNTAENSKFKLDLEMGEGVVLNAFYRDGHYTLNTPIEMGNAGDSVKVTMHEDPAGHYYLTYELKPGSTGNFDLSFSTPNGITRDGVTAKVTPSIVSGGGDNSSATPADGCTLTWKADFDWGDVKKTVDRETVEPTEGKTLSNNLVYTIENESTNNTSKQEGEIWTDYVTFTDTFTLPEGLSFVDNGPYVCNTVTGTITDKDGQVVCTIKNNKAGGDTPADSFEITTLNLSGKTITYTVKITNPAGTSGNPSSYTNEMGNPSIQMTVSGSSIQVDEGAHTGVDDTDKPVIENHVDFDATSIFGQHDKSPAEAKTTVSEKPEYEVTKSTNSETVKAGDEVEWTVTVTNTGSAELASSPITDTLPAGLIPLNDAGEEIVVNGAEEVTAQIGGRSAKVKCNHYYNDIYTITWEADAISAGEKFSITYKTKVADAESLSKYYSDGYLGKELTNNAAYRKQTGTASVTYEKPNVELTKTGDKNSAVDGDTVEYTITIENSEDTALTDETVTDVIPKGMVLLKADGTPITESGQYNINGQNVQVTLNADGTTTLVVTFANVPAKDGETPGTVTFKYSVQIDASAISDGTAGNKTLTNKADSSSGLHDDHTVTVSTEGAEPDKKVKEDSSLDESEWADSGVFVEGGWIKYMLSIKNPTSQDIVVSDVKDTFDYLTSGSFKSWEYWSNEKTVIVKMPGFEQYYLKEGDEGYDSSNTDWKINGGSREITWPKLKVPAHKTIEQEIWFKVPEGDLFDDFLNALKDQNSNDYKKFNNGFNIKGGTQKTVGVEPKKDDKKYIDMQKGVYGLAELPGGDINNGTLKPLSNSRYLFQSGDNMYVAYYFLARNTGETPVTVYRAEDTLPEGVTYVGISNYAGNWKSMNSYMTAPPTPGNNACEGFSGGIGKYDNNDYWYQGTISSTSSGRNVTFTFGNGEGVELEAGKGIIFVYLCSISKDYTEAHPDENMVNTVSLAVEKDARLKNSESWTARTEWHDLKISDQNNGRSIDGGIRGDYYWVDSAVIIKPYSAIVPGIVKNATQYRNKGLNPQWKDVEENSKIETGADIKWVVRVENSRGMIPMVGYTITDKMQAPYTIDTDETYEYKIFGLDGTQKGEDKQISLTKGEPELDAEGNIAFNVYSVSLKGDEYAIPAGGYAELTLITENNSTDMRYSTYTNKANLNPDQDFNGNDVVHGELQADDEGKWDSVTGTDSVFILGDYGSVSGKTIAEKDNPYNMGEGNKIDSNQHYIYVEATVDGEKDDVVYTNSVKNVSSNDYKQFVMIDIMPYPGDTGVVNKNDLRGSEFTVKLSDNPTFSIVLTFADGTKHVFGSNEFTVEYSEKTGFSEDDWNGTTEWSKTYDPLSHKSFRIKFNDTVQLKDSEQGIILPSGATLVVTYEGRIQNDADPGEFAWNSFGYRYHCGPRNLTAEPPKVGVSIPSEPTIKKVVVDEAGNDLGAGDAEFTLKFYEGELTAETIQGKTPMHELKVKQGGSAQLETKRTVNGESVGFLEEGKTYTVVEEPVGGYEIKSIEERGGESVNTNYFTFEYTADDDQLIVVTNTKKAVKGQLSVTKLVANNPRDTHEFSIRVDFSIGDETKIDSLPEQVTVKDSADEEKSYALLHDSEEEEVVDGKIIKGHIALTLKQGETLTIVKLAEGIRFKVAEISLPAGTDYVSALDSHNEKTGEPVSYTGVIGQTKEEGGEPKQEFEFAVTVTNTEVVEKTVTKVWSDDNNANGNRPDSIQVQLLADGTEVPEAKGGKATLNADNNWSYTWENLPKYKAGGSEITYTVQEVGTVTAYTSSVDGWMITNTEEVTSRSVTKVWADNNNEDGLRPSSITVQLYSGNTPYGDPVVLNAGNSWSHTWPNLPKYKNKAKVVYSVREVNGPAGYEATVMPAADSDNASFTITNTHTPEVVDKTVTKVWKGDEGQETARPGSITVQLYADGVASGDPVTLNAAGGWTYTWTGLPKKANGTEITYTVREIGSVTGYTTTYSSDTFTITNTYTPGKTSRTVQKVWNDSDDQDNLRPGSITVQLYADGVASGDSVNLNAAGGWTYTWTGLDEKDAAGKLIEYTVQEVGEISGYTTTYDQSTLTITNTYTPAVVEKTVTKVWADSNDQDGKRPGSIKVQLLANGDACGSAVELNAAGGWTHTWTDLPKNANGTEITYTVQEVGSVTGYTTAYDQSTLTITNTHTPETTDVTGTKTWQDESNAAKKRPNSINVKLQSRVKNAKPEAAWKDVAGKTATVTADANGKWTYSFANLPVYENGKELEYRVIEESVPGYLTEYAPNGKDITNTITSVSVSKVDIADGEELEGATIQILDDKGNVVDEWVSGKTPHEVKGLETGKKYTLREKVAPDGYEVTTDTEFTLKADGTIDSSQTTTKVKDGVLLVEDDMTSVKISKVDVTSQEELKGAHIQILDENEEVVAEWDSGEEPHEVKGLVTGKTYTLRETVAPDGYTVTTDTTFTLNADGTIDGSKTTTKVKDGVLLVEDDMTSVKISKVDVTSQEELKGAHIQILDENEEVVAEWDSGEEPHEVKGLVTGKTYTLRETVAPDGYTVTTDTTFTLKADGTIDDSQTTTTVEDGVLLIEDSLNKVSILKVDESGTPLAGAKLIIKDADGNVVGEPWTTADKAHDITGIAPGTYTVSELEAPNGYDVAEDGTFTITGEEKVTDDPIEVKMTDTKTKPTNYSLTVTKHVRLDGFGNVTGDVGLSKATFYVALFSDSDRTQRVSDVKKIEFRNALAGSVTFDNLASGQTYYVGETDENGTMVPASKDAVSGMDYYAAYGSNSQFTFEGSTTQGLAEFTNVFVKWPDYLYLSGQLTITKKVLLNGEPSTSTDTFYARVFSDAGLTQPASEILALSMAGGSEASVLVTNLSIGNTENSSAKYYVAETDANGTPLNPSAVTEYTISVDKSEVTLSGSHPSDTVVITNDFTEKESEFESEESEFESESETEVAKKTAPKTGDDTDFIKYLLLMALSAGACAVIFEEKRRRNRADR